MLGRTPRHANPRLPMFAAIALTAGLLAALLPAMARVPSAPTAPAGPLAAPAPVISTSAGWLP